MDFREIQYVTAIAKYQNITKAAESLYIGQPTLSKFLKGLEEDLGLSLFRKQGNKYYLTYAGERYMEKAEQILQMKLNLDLEMADILKKNIGVLRVGYPTMRCTYLLPQILPAFKKMYPNVKVEVKEGDSAELDHLILEGELDLAFYNLRPDEANPLIDTIMLAEEELLICTKKDHPIGRYAMDNPASAYPRLDARLLKNQLVILMDPRQRTRQIVDRYLKKQGIALNNTISISNIISIMDLVAEDYGVSFLFEPHVKAHSFKKPIDCYSVGEPRLTSSVVAAYRKNCYLPEYAKDYIELTRQVYGGK